MNITIADTNAAIQFYIQHANPGQSDSDSLSDQAVRLDNAYGSFKIRNERNQHFQLCKISLSTNSILDIQFEPSASSIAWVYAVEDTAKANIPFSGGNGVQKYIFTGESKMLKVSVSNPNATLLFIQLSASYYHKLTGSDFDLKSFSVYGTQISPEILMIIRTLYHWELDGRLRKMFIEARLLDLLIAHLKPLTIKSSFSLKEEDMEKIKHARKLVGTDLQKPISLMELSRKVGINDFKLKKGFKELTGETVFRYLYDLRMKAAYNYLAEQNKAVNEVAYLVGYKNAQHFITAFKRKYKTLPGKLNKLNKISANV
ncbi:helix-turn-helix transcriptional regulator [Pedobacter sp. AW1-32]|uniref:helix-turn-helix transcriptional regulator n=1 Tax=Pedobacter sp. AW1-32 TaxID=3383026 RepID=UPI003FEE34B1